MNVRNCLVGLSTVIFLMSVAGTVHAVCRQLVPGDRWYSGWVSCCDTAAGSVWKNRRSGRVSRWRRSCASYGVHARAGTTRPVHPGRICRNLRPGDRWFGRWVRCCDTARGGSIWTARSGRRAVWRGTCRRWGIR